MTLHGLSFFHFVWASCCFKSCVWLPHLVENLLVGNRFFFMNFFSRVTGTIFIVIWFMILRDINYNLHNISGLLRLYPSKKVMQSFFLLWGRISSADVGPKGCLSVVFWKISNNGVSTTIQTNTFQYYPYCWKAASPFPFFLTWTFLLQLSSSLLLQRTRDMEYGLFLMSCLKTTIFLLSFLSFK